MQPGTLVYCCGEDEAFAKIAEILPKGIPLKGNVYTVSYIMRDCEDCGQPHVMLEELLCPFVNGWPAAWFRPCRPADFGLFLARLFGSKWERPVTG